MNDAVCVCCGHGTPADGWLCRTCLDSGETWDDTPANADELRWLLRVTSAQGMTPEQISRFQSHVIEEPNSGCWLWSGSLNNTGYGVFHAKGRGLAHRFSYEHFKGPIPEGFFVCHKCDVKCCVNPDHLFAGSHTDNMRDMTRKGRHGSTKLTAADVMEIREALERDPAVRYKDIGARYGIDASLVGQIRAGKIWREAGGPTGPRTRRGAQQPNARFTDDAIRRMRAMHRAGVSKREIGRRFRVDGRLLHGILNGSRWAHVTDGAA